jgi:hypothetical protein
MIPAKVLTIEEQINKKEFKGTVGFEQLQAFHGYTSNLNSKSDYKHKQYIYTKNMKLKEQRRKERMRKEVEKACNPDQLVKFVTNFKIPSIQENKLECARYQADTIGEFHIEKDDQYRPEQPDRWTGNGNFNTIFHRESNLEMNIAKAKSQGNMMIGTKEEDTTPYHDSRKPWVLTVPDQCNKWENFVARVKVATNNMHGPYDDKTTFEHRDIAKNKKPFIAKFSLPTKNVPISRKIIPLLTATEARIKKQPKFVEYPFGWYDKNDIEGQMKRFNKDKRQECGNSSNYDSRSRTRHDAGTINNKYDPNTAGGLTNFSKGLDAARTNMNSRASMTSNVSHIRFSDLDLFDGRSTANSFRTGTHETKEQSRGLGSIPTPG